MIRRTLLALAVAAVASGGAAHVLRLPAIPPHRTLLLPVLLYHRIAAVRSSLPAITRRLTVSPADFATEMTWLSRHGFHAVSALAAFNALEHGTKLPPKPVMITFDDGYRDVLWNAAPVLYRLHMPATEFVITGRTSGPDPSFLTWGELASLQRRGVAIGSHTVDHLPLARLSTGQALVELRASRRALQGHLHHPVQWLAYPYGSYDPQVVRLARRVGYVLAFTTQGGDLQSGAESLLLRRDEVTDTTGVAGIASVLGR